MSSQVASAGNSDGEREETPAPPPREETPAPPPYEQVSAASNTIFQLVNQLPAELRNYLLEIDAQGIVYYYIGRCLRREAGHEPENWREILELCGLEADQSTRILSEMAAPY